MLTIKTLTNTRPCQRCGASDADIAIAQVEFSGEMSFFCLVCLNDLLRDWWEEDDDDLPTIWSRWTTNGDLDRGA